jgi:UDP-glucose 4-epimerase
VVALITGGAGFIGSHLADALLDEGHAVRVLDDLSTGSIENIRHLKLHERFEYTIDSCANQAVVAELVDEADVVFHLAAAVGVELIVESPVRTIETNVHCTEVVLRQAAKKKRPVFIASTSEVYGKTVNVPFREDGDLVLGPSTIGRWSYAASKVVDECLALAYWKEKKLPTVVGRLFNTVGPRQTGRYGMVIPRFVRQAVAEQPITVYGDGTQQRVFCHVQDAVRAMSALMTDERAWGGLFNIGGVEEISMSGLAERIKVLVGSSSEIVYVPYEEAYEPGFEDMQRRVPSTEKINALLGWKPEHDLDTTLGDVIEHQRRGANGA